MLGILGGILHGVGIQCALTKTDAISIIGIIVAITGLLILCSAYPVYRMITKKLRRKITNIIKLMLDANKTKKEFEDIWVLSNVRIISLISFRVARSI